MYTFNLIDSQVENIIIAELQQSLEVNLLPNKDEGGEYIQPDFSLIKSLTQVLAYYMPHIEYNEYVNNVKSRFNLETSSCVFSKQTLDSIYIWG